MSDVNNDGKLDALIGDNKWDTENNYYINLYQVNNNGSGQFNSFSTLQSIHTGDGGLMFRDLEIGRFTVQVKRDLVYGKTTEANFHQWASSTFNMPEYKELAFLFDLSAIAVEDFTLDDYDDIAIAGFGVDEEDREVHYVTIYTNVITSPFFSQLQMLTIDHPCYALKWFDHDFNWYSKPKLLVADDDNLKVYEYSSGSFSLVQTIDTDFGINDIDCGDFDNDGDNDIAVAGLYGYVKIYLNTGSSISTTPVWVSQDQSAGTNVVVADVNKDNKPDIVGGGYYSNFKVYLNSGSSPYFSSATQSLTIPDYPGTYDYPKKIEVVDIQKTGSASIVSCIPHTYGSGSDITQLFIFKGATTNPSPSTPRNLTVEENDGYPKLKWLPSWNYYNNRERDLHKYYIYRSHNGPFYLIDSIDMPDKVIERLEYIDSSITWNGNGGNSDEVEYYVKAVDDSYQASSASNTVTILIDPELQKRKGNLEPTISDFKLIGLYPNPFNPNTNIEVSLPEESDLNLEIFNLLGERVDMMKISQLSVGNHKINYNAYQLAGGTYLIKLTSKFGTVSSKFILIK